MQPEHHDPFSEGGQRGLEKLMAIGVLTEAGSRLAAEHTRVRAAKAERTLDRERAAQAAQAQAHRLTQAEDSRRARQWQALTGDPDRLREHLHDLPLHELARHWHQAARNGRHDHSAVTVLAATKDELRHRWPALMGAYDQARRDGATPPQAMRQAATYAFHGGARPHGANVHAPGGALPVLDAQLAEQIRRTAGDLDPVTRNRLLRTLDESGWSAESLAWVQTLLERADHQRQTAATAANTPDSPDTSHDEHTNGLNTAAAADARADHDTANAAAAASVPGGAVPAGPTGSAARLAKKSFPVPAAAALRPAIPPAPEAPAPARITRRRKTR